MPNDQIRYDLLVQEALCGVVKKVLGDAARDGLPGDHHFYITFRTHAPGVRLSSRMREQYPEEMTIILQHQFEGLSVNDHAFEVSLSFRGIPERLHVPFDALTGFFDPSVQFGLKFELHPEGEEAEEKAEADGGETAEKTPGLLAGPTGAPALASSGAKKGSHEPAVAPVAESRGAETEGSEPKVVSIDAFRKKT